MTNQKLQEQEDVDQLNIDFAEPFFLEYSPSVDPDDPECIIHSRLCDRREYDEDDEEDIVGY